VNVVADATKQLVDLVGERYEVAVRAHTDPLPDSTLVRQTLAPAPWFLFAGSAYSEAHRLPEIPGDLHQHPSLLNAQRTPSHRDGRCADGSGPRVRLTKEWLATLDGSTTAEIRPQVSGYIRQVNYKRSVKVYV
jgi:DNA-binding transcriptional LysR family regulator